MAGALDAQVAATGSAADGSSAAWPPSAPLTTLPGVGARTAQRLGDAGLRSLRDLLELFPRRYRELVEVPAPDAAHLGAMVRLRGAVRGTRLAWLPGRRALVTVEFAAADGTPFAVQFFNQPWLKNGYPTGSERAIEGVLEQKGKRFLLRQPRVLGKDAGAGSAVQLRYPEVEGVSAARLLQWIGLVLAHVDHAQLRLPSLPPALAEFDAPAPALYLAMHRPASVAEHEHARRCFAVREALQLFERVAEARRRRLGRTAAGYPVDDAVATRIRARLPFALTGDQEQAVRTLWDMLAGPAPMGALLQGDVGTGKTAVAAAAALAVLARGDQVAFLAPTELLAEQHHRLVAGWLQGSGVEALLLTGSLPARARKDVTAALHRGGPQLVFGTHALLSDDARFLRLGLVIVDEQHRFGVEQRMQLVHKGRDAHVLVMTATPIPRTLTLTLFGDLDLVTLRQRPHARPLPRAVHAAPERWPRVLRAIGRAVARGGRVYVVCPSVGDEDENQKGSATRLFQLLGRAFACALIHGRMPPAEQQQALDAFRTGRCPVLVGTTVLEVGVDVPEAVLMVVVAADRFGLATLHQLRGRVGRGVRRGACVLCGPKNERVAALCATTDGFALAESDLRLRGGGELLGTAQTGFGDLRALDPVEDLDLLLAVRRAADGVEGGGDVRAGSAADGEPA
ncbi:MAG: ATP-dependent DNA helicase RecG [Planctomycetota bacterium]